MPRPARATFALASERVKACRRALPTLTESDGVLSTPMVKLVSRTRVVPARSCRPPLWVIVPAAVAGSMAPPVMGKETPLDPALAGVIGVTDTPRPVERLGRAGIECEGGGAAGELDRRCAGGRGDGERHKGAGGRHAKDARESGHAQSSEAAGRFGCVVIAPQPIVAP